MVGIWDVNSNHRELEHMVELMSETLKHRGPNDSGSWVDENAGLGLGHRRLSIIDLSKTGRQPMVSRSGRYVLVYNGEVYNFREIRQELPLTDQEFNGQSDTEVILSAIEYWGVEYALQRFIGMFAFALWDRTERELVLVRDRLGIKPMYWSMQCGRLIFASELKAFRAYSPWSPMIDRNALAAFMRWNYVPTPHSIYKNVHKLAPGTLLRMRQGDSPDISKWWNFRDFIKTARSSMRDMDGNEAVDVLDTELGNAVEHRLVSDVPLGAFLSGGLDSSLIVALIKARQNNSVKTFTIGSSDTNFDEAKDAEAIAKYLETDHTELYIEPRDVRDIIPKISAIYDEPFADSSQLPTILVSELARKHVTVVLSGDGGDELFAGYSRYHQAQNIWKLGGCIPNLIRRSGGALIKALPAEIWTIAGALTPSLYRPERISEKARKLGRYLALPDEDSIYREQHTHWGAPDALVIDGNEYKDSIVYEDLRNNFPDFIDRMQVYDTLTYLPDDILTKIDRSSMSIGLEVRVPMLDHRVVRLAWSLPQRFRKGGAESKWLLRQVLSRYLPPNLFRRPKKGFSVPMASWLRGPLRDWAENLLNEKRLKEDGYFSSQLIRKEWDGFLTGASGSQESLWGVLMFQAWLDEWHSS